MGISDVSFTYDLFKWMNNVKMENAYLNTFLKEEFIEMTFTLEVKSLYTFKGIGY